MGSERFHSWQDEQNGTLRNVSSFCGTRQVFKNTQADTKGMHWRTKVGGGVCVMGEAGIWGGGGGGAEKMEHCNLP